MRLLLADLQDITRAGIRYFATSISKDLVISEVRNKKDLIKELQEDESAVVVLDHTNFDFEDAEEILIVLERFPESYWMLFSTDLNEQFLRKMVLSSQRASVLMKDSNQDEIEFALRILFKRERYICHYVSNLLLNATLKPKSEAKSPLTPSEQIVLKGIAQGKTTKEIASERNLSFHTINTHRKNIFRKLEVNNVHEAIRYAMRAGIIDMAEYYI
jgi:DNA-binding NarL/FixJ family response regulator